MLKVSFKQEGAVFTVLCYDVEVKPIIACPKANCIASNQLMLNIGQDKYYQPVMYESETGKELRYNRHHEEVFISIDDCSIKITPQNQLDAELFFAKGGTYQQWQEVKKSGLTEEVLSCILKGMTSLQAMREWDI